MEFFLAWIFDCFLVAAALFVILTIFAVLTPLCERWFEFIQSKVGKR